MEKKMTILHADCQCSVIWVGNNYDYDIISEEKGVTFQVGYFKWCPILKIWTLTISSPDLAISFEFTQKMWGCLMAQQWHFPHEPLPGTHWKRFKMIVLHCGNQCKVIQIIVDRPIIDFGYEIQSKDITVGQFKWCPILEQWTLTVFPERSLTFEFTQKIWAALWEKEIRH